MGRYLVDTLHMYRLMMMTLTAQGGSVVKPTVQGGERASNCVRGHYIPFDRLSRGVAGY